MELEPKKRKVAIIWRYIPQYRLRFYELLKEKLDDVGIELVLVYGQPGKKDAVKKDAVDVAWGNKVRNHYMEIGRWEFCWQPVLALVVDADLIIVEMANKLLVNYILLMQNALGVRKIAFWGHGKNFQARRGDWFSEWIKRKLSTKVHWWFAYNDLSARIVTGLGFPEKRMTIVQNAIDSRQLINALKELRTVDLDKVRKEIGIKGKHVGLYVGGIYPEKQIPFLLGALDIVREKIPDFEMIFIGAGVDAPLIIERSKDRPWIHYLGPRFNLEKVPYFAVSQLFLMPGLVGLAIIDCLSLDLPLVTTRSDLHSPEIDYLRSGVNGLMVDAHGDERIYAQAVVDLLNNEKERFKMIEGCKATREKYTIEAMAENFSNGIISALKN